MPSPGHPRPPSEASPPTVTTAATATKITIPGLTFQPTSLPYSATAEPVPVRAVSPVREVSVAAAKSPGKVAASGSDSEAETVIVLPDPSVGSGGTKEVSGEKEGGNDEERKARRELLSPHKRRRRSVSGGRRSRTSNLSGERRVRAGEGSGDENLALYSSDLSSAPGSSHPISPRHPRRRTSGSDLKTRLGLAASRKRKALDALSSSDDDDDDDDGAASAHPHRQPQFSPQHSRVRRRRNSTLESSPPPRRPLVKSSPPPSPLLDHSPSKGTRGRSAQTSQNPPLPVAKQRKLPPPLMTSRARRSDDEQSLSRSSSPSSRRGSPSEVSRSHRPPSATRTPGSPVSMSHKPKRDTAGRTHLHRACSRGAVEEVTTILEQGTDILNAEDNAGYMPLHEACLYGHIDVVKVLVKYGAWRDVASRVDHETPLLDAVENGHTEVIAYLLELGCDPLKRDKLGRNCLEANTENTDLAAREEINEMLRTAISKQKHQRQSDDENPRESVPADRESHSSRDQSVASPTHNSPPAPSVPITHSRRRNARTEHSRKDLLWLDSGKSPISKLREKAREGDFQMVHALLETGLKPDTETLCGAIKGGHTELVSLLLAYEAQVDPPPGQNARESSRRSREVSMPVGEETPMLVAIGRGNTTVLKYLLDNGCDPRRLDSKGKSYIEIAREREGEKWEEEVEMLKEAWTKSSGGKAPIPGKRSPQQRRKLSPKPKSSDTPRRNSTSSKQPTRLGPPRLQHDKVTGRSRSANPSHGGDDGVAVSDRESTAEPLGPPKNRVSRHKRSESDSMAPTMAKKRRRLVSGRVMAEEEAAQSRGGGDITRAELETDKVQSKRSRQEGDNAKPDGKARRPKSELVDTKMEDAPPLDRVPQKPKADRERSHPPIKSEVNTKDAPKETKKAMPPKRERTRSPPRAPRADLEKQAERELLRKKKRLEEIPPRSKPETEPPRKPKDDRLPETARRGSDVSEPLRRKDETERRPASSEEVIKKLRQQQDADRKAKQREKEREEQLARERKAEARDQKRELPVAFKKEENDGLSEWTKRDMERTRVLVHELTSIQQKAELEAKKAREDEVIERELALRHQRNEEQRKERILREEIERGQEARAEIFAALKALADEERSERERREQAAKEKAKQEQAERERVEREAREKEAREQDERDRIAREKAEKERQEREELERQQEAERKRVAEQQRIEKEMRQAEEQKREEARKLEEERKRKEKEEMERLEAERRQKEEEEKRKAEEERRRLAEIERKREEENERQRKIAEELQAQFAAAQREREEAEKAEKERARIEREKARIEALPYTLRQAAYHHMNGQQLEPFDHFIPFFTASIPRVATTQTPPTNGNIHPKREKWVLDVQVALALGVHDLSFSDYPQVERQPASEHDRKRMWTVVGPLLCEAVTFRTPITIKERQVSNQNEREKYMKIPTMFWLRFDNVMNLIETDPTFRHLLNHPKMQYTIEVKVDPPAPFKNGIASSPSREELAQRFKKRASLSQPLSPSQSPNSKTSYSTIMPPPPHFGNNHHASD